LDLPRDLASLRANADDAVELLEGWSDPLTFAADNWPNEPLRDFQPEPLHALAETRSVAVKAARGSGKSRLAAIAALWWLCHREGSLVLIVTPVHAQGHLWREVQHLWRSSSLLSKLFGSWQILESEIRTSSPLWRALMVSAESGAAIEGAHGSGGTLLLLDEAKQIDDDAYGSALGSLGADPDSRILAISTAGGCVGWFYRAFTSERDRWDAVFSYTAYDVPRLRDRAEEMKKRLGEFSILFRSQWLSEFGSANETPFFNGAKVEAAIEKPLDVSGCPVILAVDPARLGGDRTVCVARRGGRIERVITLPPSDLMTTAGEVVRLTRETRARTVVVDSTGLGAGVADRVEERFEEIMPGAVDVVFFQGGSSPEFPESRELYVNAKTEAAARLAGMLERQEVSLPNRAELIAQICSYEQKIGSNGKLRIEDGPGKSPDFGDAAIMSFATIASSHVSVGFAPFRFGGGGSSAGRRIYG
jgi:hypothetical protein